MHKSIRITGGAPARIGQYPFFGGILITMIDDSQSVCGSTLLSNTRAVTAAHCWRTDFSQAKLFTVIYDSIFLFSGGTRVSTSDVELHEDYNATTIYNDIAIIKHAWVDFNSAIHSIPIAIGEDSYVGQWVQAIGFGRTSDSPIIPHDRFLSHVFVQVITNEECETTYGPAVTNSTLCVATTGGRSTCNGDSGGPLVLDNKLIGVTSFGHAGDCTRSNPTGFTRVTCYAAWINDRL
ncbi:serine protease 1-like [Cydia amplana]|uniref:serine protease 1-like n=1 Tax=Cydia amplana TaxID=1869771 RepID=UPI002FE634A6